MAAGLLTVMAAASVGYFDAALLDYARQHPGFWSWILKEAVFTAIWVACGAMLWRLLPAVVHGHRSAFALVAVLVICQFGSARFVPRGAPIDWSASGRKLGHDPGAYMVAAGDLVRRVMARVPPRGRIAVVHDIEDIHKPESYTPDVPLFLFYLTAPRIFYFYRDRLPGREELAREGIGWTLDLRDTSYKTGYQGAELKVVTP